MTSNFKKKDWLNSKQAHNTIKSMVCLICRQTPVDVAHIKTVGSGGKDFIEANGTIVINMMPLCRTHHTQQHTIGIKTFIQTYRAMKEYLKDIKHPILDEDDLPMKK